MDVNRKLNSSDFRHWPVRARLTLCAALTVLHVLAFILLQPLLGGSVSALALFPVTAAGWLFGLRGGLLASVLLLGLTIPLLNLTMEMSTDRALVGSLAGFSVLVAVGVVVGWLSDLRELLRKELTERAQIEAALQSERDFAESLIKTAQAIVLVLDTEGRIVRFNPHMEEISGYRLDEVQGKDWFTTFLPEHERERIREIFLNALGNLQTHGNVNAILTKDGRELLIEWYDKALKDAGGNVVGILSVGQDITARKQAEQALRDHLQFLEVLLDTIPNPVFYKDAEGIYRGCNEMFARQILGLPKEDIIGCSLYDLPEAIPRDLADIYREQDLALIREPGSQLYEAQVQCADGIKRYFFFCKATFDDPAGNVAGIIGVMLDITKRKQAEAEIAGLAKFPSESPAPVLRIDADGIIIYANDSAALLLNAWGCTLNQPLPKYWREFALQVLSSGTGREAEFRCDSFTYSLSFTPIADSGYINIYGLDITERVQAEAIRAQAEAERERLLAAEREQRLVAETLTEVSLALTSRLSHGAVLNEILNQVQRIVPYSTANIALLEGDDLHTVRWQKAEEFDTEEIEPDQVLSLTDLPLDDFVVRSQKSVMIPDVRQEQRWTVLEGTGWIQSYLSTPICLGDRVLGLLRLNGATPHQFSARDVQRLQPLVSAAAIAIQNARLVESLEEEVTLAISDIIVEKQKTEIVLRSVDDAIALSNLDGRIEYVNDAYTTLTGYAPEEAGGRHIDFLSPEDVPKQVQQARQAIMEQGGIWREEVMFKRKDGRTYDAELSIAPVYDAKDTVAGFVSSHRDISRRKKLERARNQFITNVSHQLRTPITTIQLYAHLLQQEKLTEKAKQYFGNIKTEAIRLIGLIEDILVMATLESGSVIDTWRPVSIPAVVDSIISLYQDQARTSGLALEVTPLPPDGPTVNGDQARLAQALGEIVENAIGFTLAGGRVSVDVKTSDDHGESWVRIAVCDTGPGISEEEQEKVFDRFFRGSIVETGNVPGTGLGLSIAQEIVHAHGGHITVESQVGAGSTFTIWLPAGEDSS